MRGEAPDDAAERLCGMRCRLELEQLAESEMLDGVRSVTSAYRAPAEACATMRDLYLSLERVDRSLRTQLMLENSVLFPGALELAAH